MSFTTCKIHFTKQPSKSIYATSSLLQQLKLRPTKKIKLKYGKKEAKIALRRINKKGRHLYIPASVRGMIRLPHAGPIMISNENDERLKIGPLIGILTIAPGRTAERPFGGKTGAIRQYLRAGSGKAFYFAFAPQDINWNLETVNAHFLSANGWSRTSVPFPDVIYNRITNRKVEKSVLMQALKERFLRKKIPIFNWGFYDKWQIYHLLQSEPEISKHVPESILNPSPEQIKELLDKHKFIYLKPSGGSLGKGIFRLTFHPQRGYFVRFRSGNKNVLLRCKNFQRLMKVVYRYKGRDLSNQVIQQGIRLVELDQCPIDFRFHLNKNGKNEWVVAGVGAKKAGKGSITTHVRSGGQLMTPGYALTRLYGEKGKEIFQKAKQTSIKLAEAIEKNETHLIGEIGFDIGIDKKGEIWMFEANAKPGRSIFKHPALKKQGKSSLELIFEHCIYLSKFHRSGRSD